MAATVCSRESKGFFDALLENCIKNAVFHPKILSELVGFLPRVTKKYNLPPGRRAANVLLMLLLSEHRNLKKVLNLLGDSVETNLNHINLYVMFFKDISIQNLVNNFEKLYEFLVGI